MKSLAGAARIQLFHWHDTTQHEGYGGLLHTKLPGAINPVNAVIPLGKTKQSLEKEGM